MMTARSQARAPETMEPATNQEADHVDSYREPNASSPDSTQQPTTRTTDLLAFLRWSEENNRRDRIELEERQRQLEQAQLQRAAERAAEEAAWRRDFFEQARLQTEALHKVLATNADATRRHLTRPVPVTIPPMLPTADVEAYLASFERAARANDWAEETWIVRLGPLLVSRAQAVYAAVITANPDEDNYSVLKEAILQRYDLSPEPHRHGSVSVPQPLTAQRPITSWLSASLTWRSDGFGLMNATSTTSSKL